MKDFENIDFPVGWVNARLEDVVDILDSQRVPINSKARESRKGVIPYYGATGQVGWIDEYLFDDELILLGEDGAPFFDLNKSKAYVVRGKSWVNNHAHVLKACFGIPSAYIKFNLDVVDYHGFVSGTTRAKLNQAEMRRIPIPLPPLPEQHRIVAKIEELFSELDKGIENLKTAREQLKVYRQALLKHAFEGKLTEKWREENVGAGFKPALDADVKCGRVTDRAPTKSLPINVCKVKRLGMVLSLLTSGSRGWAQYYSASGDIFIRAQNLKNDFLDLREKAFVSLPNNAEGLRTRVQTGDLLITITGANVTKSALVEYDLGVAYVSQHVALCRPTKEVFPKYLYWFTVAETAGRKQLADAAYGAGKPGLNLENIRSVELLLPSYAEQQAIIEFVEAKLSATDQLDQTITTALQQSETLRQSILKKAFSGQLVPQDPHDEPAALLLERIRAERTTVGARSQTRPGAAVTTVNFKDKMNTNVKSGRVTDRAPTNSKAIP